MTNTTDKWLWTDWHGGGCPIGGNCVFKIKFRDGAELLFTQEASRFSWKHTSSITDFVAYAIRNPNYVAPVAPDYPALLKMAVEALEAADETLTSEDACALDPIEISDNPHEKTAWMVRTTLEAIRKAMP